MIDFPDNCIWHGERNDVDNFYMASDLFYFPSLFELNPIAIKEAIGFVIELINRTIQAKNLLSGGADTPYIANPSKLTGQPGGYLGTIPGVQMNAAGTPFGQAGGNTYNIAVQAIDSEGAARAVAKVLNDSASRSVPQLYNNGIKGN